MNTQRGIIFKVVLIIIAFAAGIYVAFHYLGAGRSTTTTTEENGTKTYTDSAMSFDYPADLTVTKDGAQVKISHGVAYKHFDPCDLKGDAPGLNQITDFNVSLELLNQSITSYITAKDKVDQDYILANYYRYGNLTGYRIMSAAEGCGSDIMYLSVAPDKTLIINRRIVTELTDAVGDKKVYENLPGIIPLNTAEVYFSEILSSLKVR